MKAWFESLKSGKGFLCCSNADGAAVSDVDWESKDGHYRVRPANMRCGKEASACRLRNQIR
jgi:hypothetical protein